MNIVFLNYNKAPGFSRPEDWLRRIRAYTGILEALAVNHTVTSIEQIDYQGDFSQNGVHYHFLNPGGSVPLTKVAPVIRSTQHFNLTSTRSFRATALLRELSHARKINGFVAGLKPDVVFVHGLLFPLQVIRLKRRLGAQVKIIVQNHAEKPGLGYKKFFQRIADRSVDAYLFAAKEMGLEWVGQGIIAHADKIREVMEASSVFGPSDRAAAKIRTGVEEGPVFLWVGRLDENKDPLTVVKAFLKFSEGQPRPHLYMIFHTEELLPEIKALLDNAGQTHTGRNPAAQAQKGAGGNTPPPVILVGKVPHEEMGYWYNSADFILSGSHYEGSGVAVCEAMSCGCIPVLTDILSFRTISDRGGCGVLYEAGNAGALEHALVRISKTDQVKEKEKTIARFRDHLSFEAIARQIGQIAESL